MEKQRRKVTFTSRGISLAGLLEQPDGEVGAYALFAHCFTCGKDIAAASRIARALVERGIGVLRFDFTGLGNSDGDFANTNFSSNIQDLIAAADFLRAHYHAPALLVGHSLGGTAVLRAAAAIPECVAVATIGSPFDAAHITRHLQSELETIHEKGVAGVNLAGRTFTIRKQFLDDVASQPNDHLEKLGRALLVLHSPVDEIVSIREAEKIYRAARHPKSFISLDTADHLLKRPEDAAYVADCIRSWVERFLPRGTNPSRRPEVAPGQVFVEEIRPPFGLRVASDTHTWLADEPRSAGGGDAGPDPYEHLLAALGTCTAMTLRMYADRKKLPLTGVAVTLGHQRRHGKDCSECDGDNPFVTRIERRIALTGEDLTPQQRVRLLEIADRCPVHRTLHSRIDVVTTEAR
jgi:uncharacterized OsmC-like protein/alpha/beta superfamily hydrolase